LYRGRSRDGTNGVRPGRDCQRRTVQISFRGPTMAGTGLVYRAKLFATAAHHAVGQVRKYTGEPYISHPAEVVSILSEVEGVTKRMIAAAWLHDVVEDTGVPLSVIREHFGDEVAGLVEGLTDVSRPEDGNRAARKA